MAEVDDEGAPGGADPVDRDADRDEERPDSSVLLGASKLPAPPIVGVASVPEPAPRPPSKGDERPAITTPAITTPARATPGPSRVTPSPRRATPGPSRAASGPSRAGEGGPIEVASRVVTPRPASARRALASDALDDAPEPSPRRGSPETPAPTSARRRDSEGAPAAPRLIHAGSAAIYPMPGLVETASPARARDRIPGRRDDPRDDGQVPPRPAAGVHLSPRMTAIFGGIFGLATVTSVVALLIQAVPPRNERAIIAGTSPTASGSAEVEVAPPPVKKRVRTAIPGPWRIVALDKDPSIKIETGTMDRKSLFEVLGDRGVPKAQVYRILKALDGIKKFDKSGRKDRFSVALERATKRVSAFEYEVSPSEVYQVREGDGGLLTGSRLDMKIAEEEITGAFYVGGDFAASYQAGGFEDGLAVALDEAMAGKLSTETFEEGGTVRVIAIEETALGLFSRYKRVVALEYRPADPAAKPTRFYAFNGKEAHGYWDEKGRQPYAGGWRSPVPGAPVTSRFNPKRLHPVLHTVMPHTGTDLGVPSGTPIYAAYRGVVESVGPLGPCGNTVVINHPNGITTGYCHMSRFAPGVKAGDRVGTHRLIGYVGATGRATGPHLHFFAKKDGKFFDAETLHLDGDRPVPGADRSAFLAAKSELDRRLEAIPLPEPPAEKPKPDVPAAGSASNGAEAEAPPAGGPPGKRPKGGNGALAIGSPAALASAAAEPGIHPSKFTEVGGDWDDDGPEPTDQPKPPKGKGAPLPPDPGDEDDER